MNIKEMESMSDLGMRFCGCLIRDLLTINRAVLRRKD